MNFANSRIDSKRLSPVTVVAIAFIRPILFFGVNNISRPPTSGKNTIYDKIGKCTVNLLLF